MKNYSKILFGMLALMFLSSSCTDWLQEHNFTQVTNDVIYSSEEGLKTGLNALYNLQRAQEAVVEDNNTSVNNLWRYCADDLGTTRTFNDAQVYKANMSAINFPDGTWSPSYLLIDRASAVITNARNVKFVDETTKKQLISEAKVIRAMTYFKLWQLFDNILLDTIATTPSNYRDPQVYTPASKEDILGLLKFDLDYAIANLPYSSSTPSKINQGLARHVRALVAAWEKDWQTMADQCEDIIVNGGYALQPIDKVFGADVNHKEALYVFPRDLILGSADYLPGGGSQTIGAIFQARYYEIPGSYIIQDNVYGGNAYGWTTPNNYLKSLMNVDNITGKSQDKRFTNYFYPDSLICNNPANALFGKPLPKNAYPNNFRQYHWSVMKYRDFEKAATTARTYKDMMVYRFAETLLLAAEANWELSGRDNANAKALGYINMVRQRAGVPDLTSIDQNVLLDEHALELAFEGNRWFLLKRMGVLVDRVNAYKKFGSNSTNEASITIDDHFTRWPIPQTQINLMGTFPQNSGY